MRVRIYALCVQYACMYVCIYMSVYVCAYVCMYASTYVCTYACTYLIGAFYVFGAFMFVCTPTHFVSVGRQSHNYAHTYKMIYTHYSIQMEFENDSIW